MIKAHLSYPNESKPHIKWNHVDGPMLSCTDGSVHFLTLIERLYLKINLITIEELDNKYRIDVPCKSG